MRVGAIADPLGPVHAALAGLWAAAERSLARPPDATWRGEFATAVGEIAANIARHAYPDRTELAFEFRWTLHPGGIWAQFRDGGRPLPAHLRAALPASVPPVPDAADPHAMPESGWGLAMARAALDELRYDRIDDQNLWLLVKRIPG